MLFWKLSPRVGGPIPSFFKINFKKFRNFSRKISAYNWTQVVETGVVQGSSVIEIWWKAILHFPMLSTVSNIPSDMYASGNTVCRHSNAPFNTESVESADLIYERDRGTFWFRHWQLNVKLYKILYEICIIFIFSRYEGLQWIAESFLLKMSPNTDSVGLFWVFY